jgi:hypothetical protein
VSGRGEENETPRHQDTKGRGREEKSRERREVRGEADSFSPATDYELLTREA